MANKILPKRSYTASMAPTAADLEVNELAINWADGVAYTKNAAGEVVSLTMGGGGGSGQADIRWNLFLPPAPTALSGEGSDAQVALSWTAPSVLEQTPITDYVVQYSSDAGTTWSTFADGTSTATTATVTGLTNGTEYTFRVAAVSGIGQGAWSDASAAVTPAGFSSPTQISGLQLWLDASDADTLYDATSGGSLVAADGGVARWEDKSGNARHATQGTSANRPARKTAIQGGKDVLRFDGTDDAFAFGSGITVPASHTVFSVFGRDTSGIHSALLGPTTNNDQYAFWWFTDDVVYQRSNSSSTKHGTASTATGFFCLTTKRTGTTSISVHRNGSLLASVTTGTGVTNAASGSWAGVGKAYSTSFHSGDACEILIYDSALSDADREAVETYLMTKWGIT